MMFRSPQLLRNKWPLRLCVLPLNWAQRCSGRDGSIHLRRSCLLAAWLPREFLTNEPARLSFSSVCMYKLVCAPRASGGHQQELTFTAVAAREGGECVRMRHFSHAALKRRQRAELARTFATSKQNNIFEEPMKEPCSPPPCNYIPPHWT